MVGFSLDLDIAAECLKCGRDIDPDTLRKAERVLKPDPSTYVIEKPGTCPQCGGGRARVTFRRS